MHSERLAKTSWFGRLRIAKWLVLPLLFAGVSAYGFAAPVSDSSRLFGFPYSDSVGYLTGALRLDAGMTLLEFSGRRPLYSGFLSSLLELAGHSLSATCFIQSLLVGAALCWYAEQAMRRFGVFVAAIIVAIISAFFMRFAGKTMTENLGLMLALLAWGLFYRWRYARLRSDLLLGYLALAIGLVARAGPFFMLPAILVCLVRERPKPVSAGSIAAMVALAVTPFALAKVYLYRYGSSETQGFSNFAYVLYGVARGGKGWTYANQVLGSHVTTAQVYRAAITSIRSSPGLLAFGAVRSVFDFFFPSIHSAMGFSSMVVPGALRPAIWLVAQLAFLLGLAVVFRRRGAVAERFDLWAMVGLIASLPFAPPIDADAMRAHTTAIPLVATVCAVGLREAWNFLNCLVPRVPIMPVLGDADSSALEHALATRTRFVPSILLAAIALLLIRPVLRHAAVSDENRRTHAALAFRAAKGHPTCGPRHSFTLDHVLPPVRIASVGQLVATQLRHPYPYVFEPLKRAFQRAGAYDLSYALVEETGNVAAIALPIQIQRSKSALADPLRICADRLVLTPNQTTVASVDDKEAFLLLLATDEAR